MIRPVSQPPRGGQRAGRTVERRVRDQPGDGGTTGQDVRDPPGPQVSDACDQADRDDGRRNGEAAGHCGSSGSQIAWVPVSQEV